jgi:hypothetical protein
LPALGPVLEQIGSLTERIRQYDQQLETISKETYPETELLRQVEGVGTLTALTFVLTVEDPYRASKRAAAWVLILWDLCLPKISRETAIPREASPRKVMRC